MEFCDEIVEMVWEQGEIVEGHDPRHVRQDQCGAWMKRGRYGRSKSSFGWEIDIIDESRVATRLCSDNLRPLHCQNRATKENGVLTCPVQAKGEKNAVHKTNKARDRFAVWGA